MEAEKKYRYFVGHPRGVAVDFDGKKHRNEWPEAAIVVGADEVIKALRFEQGDVGSGYLPVIGSTDVDALVARVLHVLDAAESNQALKDLVKEKLWGWFDEKVDEVSTSS